MKKFISKPAALIKYMLLAVLAVSFIACGYDDPKEEREKMAADYYAEDGVARSALIEAETLKRYIDAGYVTPDGKKVLILYVTAQNSMPSDYGSIKGAYFFDQEDYFMEARSDGPVTDSAMVASGAKINAFLREFGIDMNTLVVLTSYGHDNQMLARAFWTLKYWGFSNKHVKVLHGTDKYFFDAFATANGGQTFIDQYKAPFRTDKPTPSTFSVKELPGGKMDLYRAPIGEVLDYVKAGALKADGTGSAVVVSTMNASVAVTKSGSTTTETYVIGNSRLIEGRINGATQLALTYSEDLDDKTEGNQPGYNNAWSQYIDSVTGKFKTEEELRALIKGLTTDGTAAASFLPEDKNKRIMFHCVTGRTTAPHWFVAREILGYTNAAIYDGSWSEWTNLTYYGAVDSKDTFVNQQGTSVTPATEYVNYDFNTGYFTKSSDGSIANVAPNSIQNNIKWDTARYTKFLTFNGKTSTAAYDNSYNGDGREINKKDKAYQAGEFSADEGGNSGGAASGGGSAPAGC